MGEMRRGNDSERQALEVLERGRSSYAEQRWGDAFDALSRVATEISLEADDLERLAWSAALTGHEEVLLQALEALYHARTERGEGPAAARAAFWLGFRLYQLGESGRAGGWLGRAQRAVECEDGDCAERGYLRVPEAHRALMAGDLDTAHARASEAAEAGERHGEADLVALARHLQGRVLLRQGRVDEGMALLDEAMLAASGGELSPIVTGLIYCAVISACQQVYALDRAREWTAALAAWCDRQPQLVTFTGSCLVHRAEIMQLGGAWGDALAEACRAADRFSDAPDPEAVAEAHYQQAEIHRLRGELGAAEEAYRNASRFGGEAQPGLALLRVAEGRPEVGAGAIRRVLGATEEPLMRAKYLPAAVEILLAAGEVDEARVASEELEVLAERFGTEVLAAMAAHARGAVRLADDDAAAAVEPLRRAFRIWQQVGAPYIAARIRVLLARACRALGDPDGARLELEAAQRVFDQLGAAAPPAAGEEPSRRAEPPEDAHGLSPRELEVLGLVAAGKTNAAIARELGVSVKTVDRHVSNIFTKLDVSSRAAATAFAYRHGLV